LFILEARDEQGVSKRLFYSTENSKLVNQNGALLILPSNAPNTPSKYNPAVIEDGGKIHDLENRVVDFLESLYHLRKITDDMTDNKTICSMCPVVHLCKSSIRNESSEENWKNLCDIQYQYNVEILGEIITMLTGYKLESINGRIMRPA